MKVLPLSILATCLSGTALAQCDGPPIDEPRYVGSLGSFENGRLSYMTQWWDLRDYAAVDGAWSMVDSFTPDVAGVSLSLKIALGFRSGSLFVVGAPEAGDVVQGEVHIRDGAGDVTVLSPPDGAWADGFGEGLAMHGDLLVVGATMALYDAGSCGPGKGYVYSHEGGEWQQIARFDPHDFGPSVVTAYGYSVDTDGRTIVFGSPGDGTDPALDPFQGPGAVYVYEEGPTGWREVDKLVASDGTRGSFFGQDVVVLGDQMLVGAPTIGAGAVYVFERFGGTWQETQVLTPSVGADGDRFGFSLDIEPGRVAIGAPRVDGDAFDVGAVYVFEQDAQGSWVERHRHVADGAGHSARYGDDVLLGDNKVFYSTRSRTEIRFLSLGIESAETYCTSQPNSTGAAAAISASGCDSRLVGSLTLEAASLPPNASGLFFYGPRTAHYPFGNGTMCIGAGRRRLGVGRADAAGVMRETIDFQSPQARFIEPGATWYFQAYFRDRFTGAGFDLSDGLAIEIRH